MSESDSKPSNPNSGGLVEKINVADEIKNSFLDYSMSVIISRALPDVRDGLKPSQRRILYAMNDLGVGPSKKHIKCAKIVGETMGNYHPHGDQAIYPTLVHMAQPWAMRDTLVEGQGNFGSVEGDPPASMRYTEARMTYLGSVLMDDMEKDTVDFVPKVKMEIVCSDDQVQTTLDTVMRAAQTGQIGDGKIFVSSIEQAIRIRTGESGEDAL